MRRSWHVYNRNQTRVRHIHQLLRYRETYNVLWRTLPSMCDTCTTAHTAIEEHVRIIIKSVRWLAHGSLSTYIWRDWKDGSKSIWILFYIIWLAFNGFFMWLTMNTAIIQNTITSLKWQNASHREWRSRGLSCIYSIFSHPIFLQLFVIQNTCTQATDTICMDMHDVPAMLNNNKNLRTPL